jgi:phenylacetate-coenzyme A ligase PaaK-like adenylate-forming protein
MPGSNQCGAGLIPRPAPADRGIPPVSGFVSTEGLAGHTQPGGTVMRLATDMCLVELVDVRNQPVTDGAASAKVLVTNLHNHTQPLIRYELTDRFIRHPAIGDPYLHATVEGRADDSLRTAGLREPRVHVQQVAAIARHPQTGKTRCFIPR